MALIPKISPSQVARLEVLEERLNSFDEISRQMLTKLEQAVDKISESNQNISRILARHEERIDKSNEANTSTLRLIERTETEINTKISGLERSVEDLKKTRWVFAGVFLAVTFLLPHLNIGFTAPPAPVEKNPFLFILDK